MNPDPVREHLDTRTEAEIGWHVAFLGNTRQRLLRRTVTRSCPPITPEQLDLACLKAERELATYRLAQMLISAMGQEEREAREARAAQCVTAWTAARKRPEYSVGNVA